MHRAVSADVNCKLDFMSTSYCSKCTSFIITCETRFPSVSTIFNDLNIINATVSQWNVFFLFFFCFGVFVFNVNTYCLPPMHLFLHSAVKCWESWAKIQRNTDWPVIPYLFGDLCSDRCLNFRLPFPFYCNLWWIFEFVMEVPVSKHNKNQTNQ